jgi:hypothetical protein
MGDINLLSIEDSLQSRLVPRNASAVSDAPHMEWQVDFWRRAGRVRYSCLKEAAGEEVFMQLQWCCCDAKDWGNR